MSKEIPLDVGSPVHGFLIEGLNEKGLMDLFLELAGDIEHQKFNKSGRRAWLWRNARKGKEGIVDDYLVPPTVRDMIAYANNEGYHGRMEPLFSQYSEVSIRSDLINLGLFGLVSAYAPTSKVIINPQVETDLINFAIMSAQNLYELSREERDNTRVSPHIIDAYCARHDVMNLNTRIEVYFRHVAPERFRET